MLWGLTQTEMILSPLPEEELKRRLELAVKPANYQSFKNRSLEVSEEEAYLFNGKVSANKFAISLVVDRPNNFLPLIKGSIEGGKKGSLISLQYKLFPSVVLLLGFWVLLMLLFSLISFVEGRNYFTVFFPLVILAASYILIISRFKVAYNKSRKELMRILN